MLDYTSFLTPNEVATCIGYANRRALSSKNFQLNRVLFRLSCCCGLRRCEIAGLNVGDVVTDGERPVVRVRAATTKGKNGVRRSRSVPLWWDSGTWIAMKEWKLHRQSQGAGKNDPFLCRLRSDQFGKRMSTRTIANRWRSVLRCLPEDRRAQLSCHKGRHSAATYALAAGHSLVEVQHMLGHASVHSTSVYLHLVDRKDVPDTFAFC